MNYKEGAVLVFDKPFGWTSFQLVNKVRWLICKKYNWKKLKVGHAGTLDPLATGLMIICTGGATKKIDDIQAMSKQYLAEITFGASTPSFDLETEVDKIYNVSHITEELIREKIQQFKGEIEQVPPLFSAKKVNGVRAYQLARNGVEKELKPAKVTIYAIELLKFSHPVATFSITCSKGTYIRSLARDLGYALESGGYLTALRRTAVGDYKESDAQEIETFQKKLNFV